MKASQVRGNTWVLEGEELIPFYQLSEGRCILLDTGLLSEREELEQALSAEGLVPVGILCSHAHTDHCANNGYFQAKYQIPVALTAPEAGMCSSVLTLKCYFLLLTPEMVEQDFSHIVHTPDVIIPSTDGPFEFQGVTFQIVHTPGHSAGHIAVVTPDDVCYTGDALLSWEMMNAKLPYELHHKVAAESREKLKQLSCSAYIMAHRGICSCEDMERLVKENQDLMRRRTEEVFRLIQGKMTFSQINEAVCDFYHLLTRQPKRALRFERNTRFFVEYLVDQRLLRMECQDGVVTYQPNELRTG